MDGIKAPSNSSGQVTCGEFPRNRRPSPPGSSHLVLMAPKPDTAQAGAAGSAAPQAKRLRRLWAFSQNPSQRDFLIRGSPSLASPILFPMNTLLLLLLATAAAGTGFIPLRRAAEEHRRAVATLQEESQAVMNALAETQKTLAARRTQI